MSETAKMKKGASLKNGAKFKPQVVYKKGEKKPYPKTGTKVA